MFETSFSNFGKKSMIELDFNEAQVDYKINLDFEILKTDNSNQQPNDTIIIFDEQNREYIISNYNSIFKETYGALTSDNLLKYFSLNNLPRVTTNNKFVNDGNRKHN